MNIVRDVARRFGVARELFAFFTSKRWWLIPMLIILFIFGGLIILAQSSAIAPVIYTLF